MKKISILLYLTILVLLLFPQNVKAQPEYELDSIQSFVWNDPILPNDWLMQLRAHYTYDNGGSNFTNVLYLQKDNNTPLTWLNGLQIIRTYTVDDKIESDIHQFWGGSQWFNLLKKEYGYDGLGNNNLITNYTYGIDWTVISQEVMTYNIDNLVTEIIIQQWIGSWMNSEKIINTYIGNLLMQQDFYAWNGADWDTMANKRNIYTYNGSNVSEIIEQNWSGSWENSAQHLFSYDVNDLVQELIDNSWSGSTWIPQNKSIYYWSGSGLGINSNNILIGKAFPNPFHNELNITLNSSLENKGSLQIFDIQGKEISKIELNQGVKSIKIIDPNLTTGLYFIDVTSGTEKSVLKVIKQ